MTACLIGLSAKADLSVQYAVNSDNTINSGFPAGNKPAGGASCSTWTCAQKGDATGEIDEGTPDTNLDFSASSSNTFNPEYAYQLCADSGDCQVEAQLPLLWTGHTENFTGFGVGISEGTADDDYFANCWWANTTPARFTRGTPASNTSEIGTSTPNLPEYVGIKYDQSETEISCWTSPDSSTWTQVGSTVTKTLSCTGGNCPTYVFGTSSDVAQTTFVSITDAVFTTTIDISGSPPPNPGPNALFTADAESGNFEAYHDVGTTGYSFGMMPGYGRPVCSTLPNPSSECLNEGNGDLADVVTTTACGAPRQGTYAYKLTVKNDENWSKPQDCDLQGTKCVRRRTELQMALKDVFPIDYPDAWPQRTERWIGMSMCLDTNMPTATGSAWGPLFFQSKPDATSGSVSPWLTIGITGSKVGGTETWRFDHRWGPESAAPAVKADIDGERAMFYDKTYPSSGNWPDGTAHFPNEAASKTAMSNTSRDVWHDFVVHMNGDPRTIAEGGAGFLEVFMRTGAGAWVQVLNITPGNITRQGVNFDHGISYNGTTQIGYLFQNGIYVSEARAEQGTGNWVIYLDNLIFADENCTAGACVTHDGSSVE